MIVNLEGGMGNQLFQWAFGRSVGMARNEEVFYCKRRFETDPLRRYSLDDYTFSENMIFVPDIVPPIYPEPVFQYDPGVYTTNAVTFTGHRQCERYFNAEVVRAEMKLKCHPSDAAMRIADEIGKGESAFLHLRRTDNLTPIGLAFHGIPGSAYYTRAIAYIREHHPGVRFFVFSDDPEWCRREYPNFTVVSGRDYEDIWLMSLCRHAIIANSTFSWWGAWLGDTQTDRIVICPPRWFAEPKMESKDICPQRWLRM